MKRILEVCVDSLFSARAAIEGGADRLELCSALAAGGLTPYTALLRQIRAESGIEIRCMIRPRPGDFLYSADELRLMEAQITELREAGADGFVFGCLSPDGHADGKAMEPLIRAAEGKRLTFHRAADLSRDPEECYLRAAELGFSTMLTSGAAASCVEGQEEIGRLLELRDKTGGPELLIGAGVNADVIRSLRRKYPGASSFHMSGKELLESSMEFRREGVPMGLPGMDEWHIAVSSREKIQAARAALDE